jgi:hypothetical protein
VSTGPTSGSHEPPEHSQHDPLGGEDGQTPAGPTPPEPARTSGFAIAAFVLGILPAVVLAPVFGIIALRRIKQRNQRGRGLAIAGLALSGAWALVIAIVVAVALLTGAERDATGEVAEGGDLSVFEVQTGDCLTGVTETEAATSVEAVPCDQLHDAEVVTSFELPDEGWPGLDPVIGQAEARCAQSTSELPSSPAVEEGEVFYFHPTEQSWESVDDREVLCLLTYRQPRTDSVADGA